MAETISQKLDRIDHSVQQAEKAIQRSASRRSTTALAVTTVALFLLFCLGVVNRSFDVHSNCLRGNETRQAIAISDQVYNAALLEALRVTLSNGRAVEQQQVFEEFIDSVGEAIDADPDLRKARYDQRQRKCSYWPF